MTPAIETHVDRSKADISKTRQQLRGEADILHRTLFGADAPTEIGERYALAIETLPLAGPRGDLTALSERGVDLEAVELALRQSDPFNFLTQRVRVLCYLVEAQPDDFHRFVNRRPRFLVGFLTLAWVTLRSVYLAAKGRALVRKYGLG